MTTTAERLIAEFGQDVPLHEVLDRYFGGMKLSSARAAISRGRFPVPVFHATPSPKSTLMIRCTDLAAMLDRQHQQAHAKARKSAGGGP